MADGDPDTGPSDEDEDRASEPDRGSPTGAARWQKVVGIIGLVVIVFLVILLVSGGHSPPDWAH